MAGSLRVGIIGAGNAGAAHAMAFARLPGVQVAAVWSRTRARAEVLAARLGPDAPRVYDGWEELIREGGVDAVSVATVASVRREPISAALERGLHVLTEKQLALTTADAAALAALARRAGTVAAVSLNWRYAPGIQAARRAVADGRVGRLRDAGIDVLFHLDVPLPSAAERLLALSREDGAALVGAGSHMFDLARFVTGWEFVRVAARMARFDPAIDPEQRFEHSYRVLAELSGGLGTFRFLFVPADTVWEHTFCGDEGAVLATTGAATCQRAGDAEPMPLPDTPDDEPAPGVPLLQHTWNRLIADFVTAARRGDAAHASVPHLPTFADGLRLHEVFAAARRADAERRWTDVEPLL